MTSSALILGFDCAGPHCAAALLLGAHLLLEQVDPMSRGQAERLMPMLEEMLTEAGKSWRDLDAIGVGVGPGNFTGIRIAVSAARGLALGLAVPAVGVTGCEARAGLAPDGYTEAIPAPRDQVYLCSGTAPQLMSAADAEATVGPIWADPSPTGLAANIARITATRWRHNPPAPAPLYLRAADAAPARDVPPPLIDP